MLRDRLPRLSGAIIRISASLDPDTILQEVVESTCALTGARYGVITTIDLAGEIQDVVTAGLTSDERQQLADWPDGPRLLEHFRDLPAALRLADLPTYVRSLGYSAGAVVGAKTLLGTPMRHRRDHVGNLFLAEKEDGREFTNEDEEVAVLFASQAAAAITNARTHHNERRARADLEALFDTSPVGVAVLDPRSAKSVSLNREAKRILQKLKMPGRSPEELLEVLTCRRANDFEAALDPLPLARAMSVAETLRAEEIVLQVPDGRSVVTLLNATPIRSSDGEVESVVVTMQDLTSLERAERLRAEFIDMVNRELRAPLTAIKGSAATALGASPGLDPVEMLEFFQIINKQADHMRGLISDLVDAGRIATGTLSVTPEPSQVAVLVDQARSTFLVGGSRHPVLLDLPPDLPRVLADRHRIVQVLSNLLSNAARYSPESSPIRVAAERDGVHVMISVSDEGRGEPSELLPGSLRKYTGFVGAEGEHGLGRSELGLALCKGLVEAHGGRIGGANSGVSRGATFTFTVPVAEEADDTASAGIPRRSSRTPSEPVTPILVVYNDLQTLRFVGDALRATGYSPILADGQQEWSGIVSTAKPHLILLDLLPGTDGIQLMESLRELTDLPVIVVTTYGRDETVARALDAGAVDYIVRPFSPTELTTRIGAALRRRAEPEPFVLRDLAIDYEGRRVTVAGRSVQLTATEYDLLRVLSRDPRRVKTYDYLIHQVWGGPEAADPTLVRAFVKKVRRKLGDDATRPVYILNERGVGYRMGGPEVP